MVTVAERLQQGIAAAHAGQRDNARRALREVLVHEPRNAAAWFWLSKVLPQIDQALWCVERVLEINPDHSRAREARAVLQLRLLLDDTGSALGHTASVPAQRRPYLLGEALVEAQIITQAQLQHALQVQARQSTQTAPLALGQILLQLGMVRATQIEAALAAQIESTLARSTSAGLGKLGEFLIRRGCLTIAQLHQALAQQARLRAEERGALLGDILVNMGYVERAQLNQALLAWHEEYDRAWA